MLALRVYLRNSTWRNVFAVAGLSYVVGLAGSLVLDHYPVLHALFALFAVAGFIVFHAAFFVLHYDRSIVTHRIVRSEAGLFWMRIFAVLLWLGVLPFVCLWVYDRLHHLR